ncbi:tetratricopeptide repeat protein [Gimesia sp.]|uniref:tetratricopeptide repeat protein n=1 Tax=Gimesia sp. TaxID=2024833 RepID=UPI000C42302C|nr:tetratricopeptide repeat protein [Gimesia sp.]MAX37779.1 hypothetical protein [Gimesia sp.]HAH44720.1 hypothetical protein [Planctomycetaceae bacterium]HBL44157.1 hypothetical protein [Planctomycetaceae bacterium]|tara:strand:- start:9761 stop:10342 length:582 start_codon:yes stop_codon:yes gene_type:complete
MRSSIIALLALSWTNWWLTTDQQGQRLFKQQKYQEAAKVFQDPRWQGTAWYRAGEFEKAAQAYARASTPQAKFNAGNAWMLLGKYETAIEQYDQALKLRPEWKEAEENRAIAEARAKMKESTGGDLGDQREGADKIVYDRKQDSGGQDTETAGEQASSDASIQSIWLRRVQTNPADFLRSKFAYQYAREEGQQ